MSSLHEVRESYDVASPDGVYPDEYAPSLRKSICKLAPELCQLTIRLLKCMALALGQYVFIHNLRCLLNWLKTVITYL